MPEPLGFDGRSGELTTSWVPGTRLGERGRVGGGVSRAVEVGILLADLHGSGVVVEGRVRDRQAIARSVARKVADVAADPTTSSVVLDAFLEASLAVDRAWAEDDTARRHVLSHGDLSPHHVVVSDSRAGPHRLRPAPDGRARAGPRLVGRVDVGHRGRARRAGHDALLGDLVCGYAARARRAPADRAALEVHLAVDLVRIVHGWPALRHDTAHPAARAATGDRAGRPAPDPAGRPGELAGPALSPRAAPGGPARPRGRGSARVGGAWR